MYEQFYCLREKPFALIPDPAFLFPAKRHRHALTMLEYALSQASGFALITGEVGCGKTTVVRHFLERTAEPLNVAFITNAYPGFGPLLPWIMDALGQGQESAASSHSEHSSTQPSPIQLWRRFVSHVQKVYAAGVRTVLVIDEAQNLSVESLEELRVLSNVNAGKDLQLQTVLIGQPELRQTLRQQNMRQLAQRIVIDHHLEALQPAETSGYIKHRLTVAGGKPDLFSPEALHLVHQCTGGVPRLVNIICDTALVYGFSEQRPYIDVAIVEQVIQDRSDGGLLPLRAVLVPA